MKRILALFALLAVGQAPAATQDLGLLSVGVAVPFSEIDGPGPFADWYKFSIAAPSVAGFAAANFGAFPTFDTKLISISLISNPDGIPGNGDDSLVATNGAIGNTLLLASVIVPGNYFVSVGGNAIGSAGGVYYGNALIQAVPEPESWALMLAGIATVGALIRRRGI